MGASVGGWSRRNRPGVTPASAVVAAHRNPVSTTTTSVAGLTTWRIAAPNRTRPYSPPLRTRRFAGMGSTGSSTHSHALPTVSCTPNGETLVATAPMEREPALSRSTAPPSSPHGYRRPSLPRAPASHSASDGNRFPSDVQYAFAHAYSTPRTGCRSVPAVIAPRGRSAPEVRPPRPRSGGTARSSPRTRRGRTLAVRRGARVGPPRSATPSRSGTTRARSRPSLPPTPPPLTPGTAWPPTMPRAMSAGPSWSVQTTMPRTTPTPRT